jgi:DnaJ-like protein
MPQTYYQVLGVPENATAEEIEVAFKSRAREVHPDKVDPGNPYLQRVAAEAFKDLSEAKAVLLDPAKRQKYDASLAYARGPAPTRAAPRPSASRPRQPRRAATRATTPASGRPDKYAFWKILGASVLLFILAAMAFDAWVESPPFAPQPPVTSPGETQHAAPATPQGAGNVPPAKTDQRAGSPAGTAPRLRLLVPPDLSSLSTAEQDSIASVCRQPHYSDYSQCVEDQLERLAAAPPRPDLSGLSIAEQQSIEAACAHARYFEGPAAYNVCLSRQVNLLQSHPTSTP